MADPTAKRLKAHQAIGCFGSICCVVFYYVLATQFPDAGVGWTAVAVWGFVAFMTFFIAASVAAWWHRD